MLTQQTRPKPIPKKIHFIWLGGKLPFKYLQSIIGLARVAKESGFELNLWVDDEKNYRKSVEDFKKGIRTGFEPSDEMLDKMLGIKIRNIDELKNRMEGENADPFYKGTDPDFPLLEGEARARSFWEYVNRESVGSKNLAAASDLLREEIVRQEGGCYFDTDIEFPSLNPPTPPDPVELNPTDPNYEKMMLDYKNKYVEYRKQNEIFLIRLKEKTLSDKLQEENPILGIKLNVQPKYGKVNDKVFVSSMDGNNDVICARPNHRVIRDTIVRALKNYKKLEELFPEDKKRDVSFFVRKKATRMDVKRYPYYPDLSRASNYRLADTLVTSGPGVLMAAMQDFWDRQKDHSFEAFQSFQILVENAKETKESVFGVEVKTKCDSTWLKFKNKDLRGYDMDDIPEKLARKPRKL